MSEKVSRLNKRGKKAAVVIAAAVLCAAAFFARMAGTVHAQRRIMLCVCDALTEVGLGYLLWGIILYFSHKGAFDGLFYLTHNIAEFFRRTKEDYISYGDFVKSRSHKPGCFGTFICLGAIMLAAGLVVMLVRFRLMER